MPPILLTVFILFTAIPTLASTSAHPHHRLAHQWSEGIGAGSADNKSRDGAKADAYGLDSGLRSRTLADVSAKAVHAAGAYSGLASLERGRQALLSLLNLIYHRYEMNTPYGADLFRVYLNMGNATWTALRTKFAKKIVLAHLHRRDGGSSTSKSSPPRFLYVFGGSSVTSGHDNYYNQSYPSVFDRRMRPVFEALGIELRVRNIAMGSTGCDPYNACYGPQTDNDPDFVSWEQSYFCKRSPSMETLARYTAASASHALMMFQASGSSIPRHCNASAPGTVPYNSEHWSPSLVSPPPSPWAPSTSDVRRERDVIFQYNAAAATGAGFYNWLGAYHPLIKPSGLESWAVNAKAADKKMASHDAIISSCKLKFATNEISTFGVAGHKGARHHPTASSHMMRAEAIAWLHGLVLLDALAAVSEDLQRVQSSPASGAAAGAAGAKGSKALSLAEKYNRLENELFASVLPAPTSCGNTLHCAEPVMCYNDYHPHFNPGLHLSGLVVGITNWTYVNETAAPSPRWAACNYQDFKQYYSSFKASGELHIRVNVSEASRAVQFCGQLKNAAFYLTPDVPPSALPSFSSSAPGRKRWTAVSQPLCTELSGLPPGSHVISIGLDVPLGEYLTVTHVLMWA